MAGRMKLRKNINSIRNRKGSYILETAMTLPVFIIALLVMSSIILMYTCIEDANFVMMSELRRASIEAMYMDSSVLVPQRIKSSIKKHSSLPGELRTTDYIYRDSRAGLDELIGISICMRMEAANPLGLASSASYELSCITRAYVGKIRSEAPMSEAEFEGVDSEPVYIFPNRGVKYHKSGCGVLTAESTACLLSDELMRKYKACPKCRSRQAAIGSLVYVFPNDGEDYHLSGCDTLERNYIEIERKVAVNRGYTACLKCGG